MMKEFRLALLVCERERDQSDSVDARPRRRDSAPLRSEWTMPRPHHPVDVARLDRLHRAEVVAWSISPSNK